MKAILGTCSHAERQTCLFSATMPKWVRTEAPKYMHHTPEMVDLVGDAAVRRLRLEPSTSRPAHPARVLTRPSMVPSPIVEQVKASTDVRHVAIPAQYSERAQTVNAVIKSFTSATGRAVRVRARDRVRVRVRVRDKVRVRVRPSPQPRGAP